VAFDDTEGGSLSLGPLLHPAPVSAVVFDLGGVFLDWDPRNLYRKLFGPDEQAMERFLSEVCTNEWHFQQDLGKSVIEACAELAGHHPDQAELIWAWATRNDEMVSRVDEDTVAVLAELRRAGMPCYVLSNMEPEAYAYRLSHYPFLSWFEGQVISSHVGLAKPDPSIFKLCAERFGLVVSRTLFVDDRTVNIDAALGLGWQATRFVSAGDLRDRLADLGVLSPTRD
jgi:2-haloacid dehalogenase